MIEDRPEKEVCTCKGTIEKDKELLKEQNSKVEDEVNEIKKASHGQLARVFKMRKKITGGKKQGQEPSAIRDPETGDLIVESSMIKAATLKYCVDNLMDNKLYGDAEKLFKLKETLHHLRMKEDTRKEFDIEDDEFEDVLKVFAKKDTKTYDSSLKHQKSIKRLLASFA